MRYIPAVAALTGLLSIACADPLAPSSAQRLAAARHGRSVAAERNGHSDVVGPASAAESQIELVIAMTTFACNAAETSRCRALLATLDAARRSASAGNVEAADGQLHAFIRQVVAFQRTGTLSADAAQSIVNQAGIAIELLRT